MKDGRWRMADGRLRHGYHTALFVLPSSFFRNVPLLQCAHATNSRGASTATSHATAPRFPTMNSCGQPVSSRHLAEHIPPGLVVRPRERPEHHQARRRRRVLTKQVEQRVGRKRGSECHRGRQRVSCPRAQDEPCDEPHGRDGRDAVRVRAMPSDNDVEVGRQRQRDRRQDDGCRQSRAPGCGVGQERGCEAADGMPYRGRHSWPYSSTESRQKLQQRSPAGRGAKVIVRVSY